MKTPRTPCCFQRGAELPRRFRRGAGRLAAFFLLAAAPAFAADAGYTLGVPGAPVLRIGGNAEANAWLAANPNYPAMSIVAPGGGAAALSAREVAGADQAMLAASEAGFPIERTKPEYYLGDVVEPPLDVDWAATYDRFLTPPTVASSSRSAAPASSPGSSPAARSSR